MNNARFGRSIPLTSLLSEVDRLFGTTPPGFNSFAVNQRDTDTALEFHAFVPGITREDNAVSARVDDRVLVITVKAPLNEQPDNAWVRVEHRRGDAERFFRLPDDVDTTQIKAKLRDGVLVVSIPKVVAKPAQTIEIDPE